MKQTVGLCIAAVPDTVRQRVGTSLGAGETGIIVSDQLAE
jgi:hypothetical protein